MQTTLPPIEYVTATQASYALNTCDQIHGAPFRLEPCESANEEGVASRRYRTRPFPWLSWKQDLLDPFALPQYQLRTTPTVGSITRSVVW